MLLLEPTDRRALSFSVCRAACICVLCSVLHAINCTGAPSLVIDIISWLSDNDLRGRVSGGGDVRLAKNVFQSIITHNLAVQSIGTHIYIYIHINTPTEGCLFSYIPISRWTMLTGGELETMPIVEGEDKEEAEANEEENSKQEQQPERQEDEGDNGVDAESERGE